MTSPSFPSPLALRSRRPAWRPRRTVRRHARRLRRALSDACGGDVRTAAFLVVLFALALAASFVLEAA